MEIVHTKDHYQVINNSVPLDGSFALALLNSAKAFLKTNQNSSNFEVYMRWIKIGREMVLPESEIFDPDDDKYIVYFCARRDPRSRVLGGSGPYGYDLVYSVDFRDSSIVQESRTR